MEKKQNLKVPPAVSSSNNIDSKTSFKLAEIESIKTSNFEAVMGEEAAATQGRKFRSTLYDRLLQLAINTENFESSDSANSEEEDVFEKLDKKNPRAKSEAFADLT
jgi:hypothetical protein